MSVVYKVTFTRPNFDSLFFLEAFLAGYNTMFNSEVNITQYIFDPPQSNAKDYSYEPNITWFEVNTRKHELRPDLLFYLDSIGIESIISNPTIYAPYPAWNPFSLSWTHLFTFDTVENALTDIYLENVTGSVDSTKDMIKYVENTVTYEELLVNGITDPTFVKKYL